MDPEDLEIEEGPLSDISQNLQNEGEEPEEEGFTLQYLLGVRDPEEEDFQAKFYRLQVEETLFSSLESANLENPQTESTRLRLDVSNQVPIQSGRIVFSPGGSEAFVYPSQQVEQEVLPESENRPERRRPTTVGGSFEDVPSLQLKTISQTREEFLQENFASGPHAGQTSNETTPMKKASTAQLQVRLEDFKTSLDMAGFPQDIPSSVTSSTNPSPRRFRIPAALRERFLLHNPENDFNIHSVSEHELTGDAESAAETNSPLMTSRSGMAMSMSMADRATSPSMASVTSGYSAASSVPGRGVRLEWDSGADLGYVGGLFAQRDAAASLSTLEKLAIGNYSIFFRSEPEGKSSRDHGASRIPILPRLPGPDREDEMRQMRLQSYANSLLRQSQRHPASNSQTNARGSQGNNNPPKSASDNLQSEHHASGRSKSDTTPEISPSRKRRTRHRNSAASSRRDSRDSNRTAPFGSPMRSSSLTDLSRLSGRRSSNWFSKKPSPPQYRSEPSSSSSTATVVPTHDADLEPQQNAMLRSISTDPRSLPPELQGLMSHDISQLQQLSGLQIGGPTNWQNMAGRASHTSLSSRYSASRSFETVIRVPDSDSLDTEEEIQLVRRSANCTSEDQPANPPMTRHAWALNVLAQDPPRARSLPKETPSEAQRLTNIWLQKRAAQFDQSTRSKKVEGGHKTAWTTSNDDTDSGVRRSRNQTSQTQAREGGSSRSGRRSVGTHTARWSNRSRMVDRGSSMPATTSEDDLQHTERGSPTASRSRRRPSYPTNTSTLESAAHIDRAKSFEYFPGESFPLQENSSSYEYLPGHMVDDRPGTVASKRAEKRDGNQEPESKAREVYTSEYMTTEDTTSPQSSSSGTHRRSSPKKLPNDLGSLTRDLLHKSKELQNAHMTQTKDFYRRLKKYIAFVSTPSLTPEDCRMKQEVASQILSLVKTEESKLSNRSPRPFSLIIPSNPDISAKESESESTRQTGIDTADRTGDSRHKHRRPKRQSRSSLSEIGNQVSAVLQEPTQPSLIPDDIQVQQMRIEQMRKLRKELRKLEKLERLRLNKAVGGSPSVEEELLRQIENESFDSVSTNLTDISRSNNVRRISDNLTDNVRRFSDNLIDNSRNIGKASNKKFDDLAQNVDKVSANLSDNSLNVDRLSDNFSPKTLERQNIEGQSESDSLTTTHRQTTASSIPTKTVSTQKSHSETITKKISSSTQTTTRIASQSNKSSIAKIKSPKEKIENKSEFGQTFPTPRNDVTGKEESVEVLIVESASEENRSTHKNSKSNKTSKRSSLKPIAFYLPLDNQSPIIIGKRTLREKSIEEPLGKENRNIFSNYMAGLDLSASRINRKRESNSEPEKLKPDSCNRLSLQESLARKRPNLIMRFKERARKLNEMKQLRLEYESQVRAWLAVNADGDQNQPQPPPGFTCNLPRLFDYQEMVRQTRKKYESLPEVRQRQLEAKRRSTYRTNRLMASVFKRRLKTKVLKGKVSMTHRTRVF